MATIFDTKIYVYSGVSYNPDGSEDPWSFCTAWFDDEDWCGEYIFNVDGDRLYPTGTVGNGVTGVRECKTYNCYNDYMNTK